MNTGVATLASTQPGDEKNASASELLLIAQAKSGHSAAFGELYERHRMKIYHSAFRILRNRQDAEDAVQLAFQRAFCNLRRFREDSTFSTWVTRIGINEALMLLRRRRPTIPLSEDNKSDPQPPSLFDTADSSATPEQAAVERERRAAVMKAISCLPAGFRAVILLREFRGLTNAETARLLGLTVPAVKGRTHHARRYLRRHLERKYKAASMRF